MLAYDRQIEPPAPSVDVLAAHPRHAELAWRLRAKLDTGSDILAIPLSLITELGLLPESQIVVEGYDSRMAMLDTCYVALTVAQVRFRLLEVIAFPEPYILLGRDVLNDFYVQLNGPELTFDLSLDNPGE